MRLPSLRYISMVALGLFAGPVAAANPPLDESHAGVVALLTPQSGLYYPTSEPGQGVVLENLGNGRFFGAYLGYDAAGAPTWISFSGAFEPSTDREVLAGAPLGELEAFRLKVSAGSCFTCPYTAPAIATSTVPDLRIEFLTPTQIQVTMDGVTKRMSLPDHTIAKGTPTATTQHDNPMLRKLTGIWTMRLRQTIDGQTVTKQGRVVLFAVPLSAPLAEREQQANNQFVYGIYCNDPACDAEVMPVLTAGAASGESVRPIVFWNATSRSGQLKVFTQADAPSGVWIEQPSAAIATMMQNGSTLSGIATALGNQGGRQDITLDLTPGSLWFP